MKKYIILTSGISDMGGAEMFNNNKVDYLMHHGWEVDVFYFGQVTNIMLTKLRVYSENRIPELGCSFARITKKNRDKIILKICNNASSYKSIVIESQLALLAQWGEIIAAQIGAKHILNCMEEKINSSSTQELAFFEFKLRRYEILNAVNKNVLKRYFGSKVKPDYDNYLHNYLGKPICSNVTANITYDISYIEQGRFNIISLGRLDKPYIEPLLKDLKDFFS